MIEVGDRVRFTAKFLRSTGQYTGEPAPTSYGPFARGEVLNIIPLSGTTLLAEIKWDDTFRSKVNIDNLEKCR
jgi:hypothetical protein